MPSVPAWKRFETRIGKLLGGRRIPVTGIGRADRDVEAGMFWYQAKLRRTIPTWLFEWLAGIVNTANDAGKIGVLVLKSPRMLDRDAVVVVRLADWIDLHGNTAGGEDGSEWIPRT